MRISAIPNVGTIQFEVNLSELPENLKDMIFCQILEERRILDELDRLMGPHTFALITKILRGDYRD